jgi:hypothetical protein
MVTADDPYAPTRLDEAAHVALVAIGGEITWSKECPTVSALIDEVNANHPGFIL